MHRNIIVSFKDEWRDKRYCNYAHLSKEQTSVVVKKLTSHSLLEMFHVKPCDVSKKEKFPHGNLTKGDVQLLC